MVEEHDAAVCDEAFRTFVAHGTWYVPTHVTRRMDAYADDEAFRERYETSFAAFEEENPGIEVELTVTVPERGVRPGRAAVIVLSGERGREMVGHARETASRTAEEARAYPRGTTGGFETGSTTGTEYGRP